MAKLAINGGKAVRTELFPAYNTIGAEEKEAVMRVLDTGNLSQFLGAYHVDFLGGPNVRAFEKEWATAFGVKHAVSVNSNTSGLFTAMGAIGIAPGDEVIVSPYSMSASAVAPLVYGGIPVFADIDPVTFCMDPASVEAAVTSKTKAILIVHIFGHPADMDAIMAIAKKHNLYVIEDCAQAPMAKYKDRYVGSIGDLGVFSLNYHKHIHTGEGGVITSNNENLIERCQMIRNRMTEIECAIGIQQLKKLPFLLAERIKNVRFLNEQLANYDALELQPPPGQGSVHTYYVHPIKFNNEIAGIDRNTFVNALKAELPSAVLRETAPLIGAGYVKPLYLQPVFQEKASWAFDHPAVDKAAISYERGLCPVTEKMHFETLFTHEFMRPGMGENDMIDVITAFKKIFDNVEELKSAELKA
jgi:perosamine synthetase